MIVYITKIFHFEAAHVLKGYDGPCSNVHGHSYELHVTVKGEPLDDPKSPKNGMVMDFGDLKKIVNEQVIDKYDHAFVMSDAMPQDFIDMTKKNFEKVIIVPFQPTSEFLILEFAEKIKSKLPKRVSLASLRLGETGSSYAEIISL